jgi:TonB family protein
LFIAGAAVRAQTTAAQKPLTKAQVYDLVASGLDSQRIVDAVQQRGIDFTPSEGLLQTLAKKGANQALLDALSAATPTPLSKNELVHLLAVGKTSQSVQAMVERRRIDFKPTDEDLDTLRIAGATDGLIKAVRDAKLPNPEPQLPTQPTGPTEIAGPASSGPGTGGGIGSGKVGRLGTGEGGGFGGGLYSVGGGVSRPIPIYCPDPPYSEQARKDKFSGTVVVQIIVDTKGDVRYVNVVKPLGHGLDEKAIETIRTWQFKPAMRNGSPVNVRMPVEVSFRLF